MKYDVQSPPDGSFERFWISRYVCLIKEKLNQPQQDLVLIFGLVNVCN